VETPLFTNPAVVLGILLVILAAVFVTSDSERPYFKKFYAYVPPLLLCYFVPSVFATAGVIADEEGRLYAVASRYLLPASLVLLTLSLDLKAIARLGPKAVVMFLAGTVSIILGGPLALLVVSAVSPETVGGAGPDAVWRGLSTIAGSWIGGGANQTAMREVYQPSDALFSVMIAVDVLVANVWMACLLFAAGRADRIDRWTGADTTAIKDVQRRVEEYRASVSRMPRLTDTIVILAIGFGITAVAHAGADFLSPLIQTRAPYLTPYSLGDRFFWIVVIATTGGMLLSASRRVRALEGVGASRIGSVLLYVLIATIGMRMNILAVFALPGLFIVGLLWMTVHAVVMLVTAYLIKAPTFFMAVGSQANVGGAASAPAVASAFHPSLAPVGVLLAVLGYALGTYGGWVTGQLLRIVAGE